MNIRALRKAYQAIELLAFLRVIAQSRTYQDHVRMLTLPRLFGFHHSLSPPWRRSWIVSTYPLLLNTNLFCSASPESTTNLRSSGDFELNLGTLSSTGKNIVLSLFMSLYTFFSPSPTLLCGPDSLALWFPHVKYYVSWGLHFWMIPRNGPFLSRFFLFGARCFLRISRCVPLTRSMPSFQLSVEQTSSDRNLEIQFVLFPSVKQLILQHSLFSTLCWVPLQHHSVGIGNFGHVCITIQFCNYDIREGFQKLDDGFLHLAPNLQGILILFAGLSPPLFEVCTSFLAFDFDAGEYGCSFNCWSLYRCPDAGARRELLALLLWPWNSQRSPDAQVWRKTTRLSFWTWSVCFPLKTFSFFPLNEGFIFLMALWNNSSLHHFWILNFLFLKVWSMCNFAHILSLWQASSPPMRIRSWLYNDNTVWSWDEIIWLQRCKLVNC